MSAAIVFIDNFDSFTYNLVHMIDDVRFDVRVLRNTQASVADIVALAPVAIVISPGPGRPENAGICVDLIKTIDQAAKPIPILGVCLGHQAIAQAFGAKISQCHEILHGKTSSIVHKGQGLFDALPSPLVMTRYHSLIVDNAGLPDCLDITAHVDSTSQNNVIMGIQHKNKPFFGVQFHPESIASKYGQSIMDTFLSGAHR